ncbi:MAG TPA: DUF4404 family protein [Aggregatilineales bacterium]|nr:DUF4404 family protein [Aggregatilineales bacterium]
MEKNTQDTLKNLHDQLSTTKLPDKEKQKHLDTAAAAIRETLDKPDAPQRKTLRGQLEKTLSLFEAEHPALATGLREAIDILAEAGF